MPVAVEFKNVSFAFDDHVVLEDVSFSVPDGSMRVLLGASGAGKSTILKLILGLFRPDAGSILVQGHPVHEMRERDLLALRADIGMVFQEMALFDSLTVSQNVGYRLYEETRMPAREADARVAEILGFVGLGEYGERMPSELSGGQRRRVALARAMASKPGLLLLDDPTTGLDPLIANTVNDEILKLRDLEKVTSLFVTHQIRDAHYIAMHEAQQDNGRVRIVEASEAKAGEVQFLMLHEGRIQFEGSAAEILGSPDPFLQEYLYNTLPPW
jgi:phospholipid/cholesterol/gamma-HCH transport system ATP-binding protein